MEVPVIQTEIDICYQLPISRPNDKNITVRLVHRNRRNALLSKMEKNKKKKGKVITDLGSMMLLAWANKQLLGIAVARKRTAGWKDVRSSGGKVFARRSDDAEVIKIASAEDVAKMSLKSLFPAGILHAFRKKMKKYPLQSLQLLLF